MNNRREQPDELLLSAKVPARLIEAYTRTTAIETR